MFKARRNCTAGSSEVLQVKKQAWIIGKMADHGNNCYVPGCARDVRTFHTLPTEQKCQQAWLMFIYNRIPQHFNSKLLVCSAHFTTDSFSNMGQYQAGFAQRLILKKGAIPTILPQATITQPQTSAVVDLHSLDAPNINTEYSVFDFCDQDSVASSVDPTAEEMFMDGLDPVLDRPLAEINLPEEDWDSDTGLQPRKRRLSSISAPLKEGNGRESQPLPDVSSGISTQRWHSVDEPDDDPPHPDFTPVQTPGPKFVSNACSNPLKFFQLFFSRIMLQEIVAHTNIYGTRWQKIGKPWDKICQKELQSYIALVIFTGLFKCPSLTDYWRESEYFGLRFPARIMSYQRFLSISNALHLSDTKKDEQNNMRKGTSAYERLGKIQPLYQVIREACKTFFHPFQNITINERMVASQARTGLKICTTNESTNNGYKLFALSDCTCGYTWDFFVYEGKSFASQSQGLSYESVTALVDENLLGTGYKLFIDKFYTSPTLCRDLLHKNIWACGPVWANRKGFPKTTVNNLPRNAPHGTIRWIRDDELLFVQWKDAQEVQICSTFHKAYEGDTVQRKVKGNDGHRTLVDIPIPAAVLDYDRNMEAMDPANCITGYFRQIHKPRKWYQSVFYHFLDIAVENAFILQELTAKAKNQKALTRRAFLEMLILKLIAGATPVSSDRTSAPPSTTTTPASPSSLAPASFHKPKHTTQDSTAGEKCELCHQDTTVMCVTCDVMLCFQPQRDCFNDWHEKQGL